jgi:hypothetical protein
LVGNSFSASHSETFGIVGIPQSHNMFNSLDKSTYTLVFEFKRKPLLAGNEAELIMWIPKFDGGIEYFHELNLPTK